MQTTASQPDIISTSNLVSSLIGAALALAGFWIRESMKRWDEKQRLINLFIAEIERTHLEIDRWKNVPAEEVWPE